MPEHGQRKVSAAVAATLIACCVPFGYALQGAGGVAYGLLGPSATALAAGPPAPHAHAASALKATDTARLRYVSASGSLLYEEGGASGTLPGSMRVHFNVGATFSGSFTIYTRGGSIKGHGSAIPHGSGIYESFAGTLVVSGGSGRFRRAHGRARLYGTFNRNSYALVVQTVGTLHY